MASANQDGPLARAARLPSRVSPLERHPANTVIHREDYIKAASDFGR
ncbi:MAG: hypothetical protein ABSA83_20230 [Verrucomicrobiota bacterium]